MHIFNPKIDPCALNNLIKEIVDPEERVYWVNEVLKKKGYRLFTFKELEGMFSRDRRTIKKIIKKMVENGHLS